MNQGVTSSQSTSSGTNGATSSGTNGSTAK
jgi:hypothetical protein